MKIGFLFGAGAEVPYNMPTGGKFALDIFRQDTTACKNSFKEMRNKIDHSTKYACTWLPDNYENKNIGTFGRSVFENLIKDTIEHNREKIIRQLNHLDSLAKNIVKKLKLVEIDVDKVIYNLTGRSVENTSMNQAIKFADEFKEGDKLFESKYFSALLLIYKLDTAGSIKNDLGKIILSILQLQLGALSESLSRKINDNPFSKKDDDIDLFDDLGDILKLNYSIAGVTGLNYLFEKHDYLEDSDYDNLLKFAGNLLEDIFSTILDYKSLIDSYWHYLYCPRIEWNKFCKISIFLLTVRGYIEEQCAQADENRDGYYDDVYNAFKANNSPLEISSIATTNYTSLISRKIKDCKIHFLNGSTAQWYDPYINKIGSIEDLDREEKHFKVPLLFTQSGTKPMTSIFMLNEYVDVYKDFMSADLICVLGFGFNTDDEHINGIIRELLNNEKKVLVVTVQQHDDEETFKEEIINRLKTTKGSHLDVMLVDRQRCTNGQLWINKILEERNLSMN